jgi:acyl-CoA thioester hydrolase
MIGTVHLYELLIHERHLDTFGHVNNAVYLDLFEAARWDLIDRNGFGLSEIQRRAHGPTILEINLRFQREIKNRERITIKTWLESYGGKVGKMKQQMVNANEEVCCDATFVFGLFDLAARKLIKPTPEWLRAVGISEADLAAS